MGCTTLHLRSITFMTSIHPQGDKCPNIDDLPIISQTRAWVPLVCYLFLVWHENQVALLLTGYMTFKDKFTPFRHSGCKLWLPVDRGVVNVKCVSRCFYGSFGNYCNII